MGVKLDLTRDSLRIKYAECVAQNPLLGRMEGECRTIGWADEEIRTVQLLVAVQSNASLQARLIELEAGLAK